MTAQTLLKAIFFTPMREGRWGLPVLFKAPPGTAKSSIIKDVARRLALPTEVLSPGMRGEGAFGVVPVPGVDSRELCYPPPDWVGKLGSRGVVFLDEINTAPPALQPPLLGLVLEGMIGAVTLPGGVRRVAAMNDIEDSAGGWELPPALANRFGHINWEAPTVDQWTDWLLDDEDSKSEVDPENIESDVLKKWTVAWAKSRGVVSGFLRTRPDLLHVQPKHGDPKLSGAWPSRRTWEFATRALASAEVHALDKLDEDTLISAFVSVPVAAELENYRLKADLPSPDKLLDGEIDWKHNKRKLDQTVAVLGACTALVRPMTAPKREQRATKLWKILDEIAQSTPDVIVPAATQLAKAKLTRIEGASAVLARLHPILETAHYTAKSADFEM